MTPPSNLKIHKLLNHAPVILFSLHTAPPQPPGSPGVRGKMCVIKKGGTLESEVKKGRGVENEGIKVIN